VLDKALQFINLGRQKESKLTIHWTWFYHYSWFLEYNLVLPDGVISLFDNRNYYDNIEANVNLKQDAGFNTSITDVRLLIFAYLVA